MNNKEIKPLLDKLGLKIATALDYFDDNDLKMAETKVNETYDLWRTLHIKTIQYIQDLEAANDALTKKAQQLEDENKSLQKDLLESADLLKEGVELVRANAFKAEVLQKENNELTSKSQLLDEQLKATISELKKVQSENADLGKRLATAVELPCKVGDTIFEVGGQYTKDIVPWKIRQIILQFKGVRFICDNEEGGNLHRCIDVYNNEMQTFWDKSPFCLTSAVAEKRLAELGGEK